MAKIGQGDPRWLVSVRDDGKNVGNWHWNESDLTPWAKKTLTARLERLSLVDDAAWSVAVTAASAFDGDVTLSTRKGKKIYFYDLSIELDFAASRKPAADDAADAPAFSCSGKIKLSDIEQDSRPDDFSSVVSLVGADCSSAAHQTVKQLVKTAGIRAIAAVVETFNNDLRALAGSTNAPSSSSRGNSSDAAPADATAATVTPAAVDAPTATATAESAPVVVTETATGTKLKTTTLKLTHVFRCLPRDIVTALTDPARVRGFTLEGSSVVASKPGEPFKLYDGTVSGTLVETTDKSITLDWRLREWPRDHHARVAMSMTFANDQTSMEFVASGVPAAEKENTQRAWDHFYWQRIKHVFGYGA
jgi:activator of HSP90 ATPase